jgi:nucleolar protein 56
MIMYTNALGKFSFDDKLELVKEEPFSVDKGVAYALEQMKDTDRQKAKLTPQQLTRILSYFGQKKYLDRFRQINLEVTRIKISESVNEDNYVIHAINSIEEITKVTNQLCTRIREWYSLFLPELDQRILDNDVFLKLITEKKHDELLDELHIEKTLGKMPDHDADAVIGFARQALALKKEKDALESYLQFVMKEYCPNMLAMAGALVGAKLLREAGSLKRLVEFPSSTIHLLGAEKALFRHLKSGARPPKYGILLQHPIVNNAKRDDKGKAARVLADKISIAVKIDYFKGEFIGDKLLEDVKKKLSKP